MGTDSSSHAPAQDLGINPSTSDQGHKDTPRHGAGEPERMSWDLGVEVWTHMVTADPGTLEDILQADPNSSGSRGGNDPGGHIGATGNGRARQGSPGPDIQSV